MSDYSSCLLQGYGVLPGPPMRLKTTLVSSQYAVIEWSPPKILADTVKSYHLNFRKLGSGDDYTVVKKVNENEWILEFFIIVHVSCNRAIHQLFWIVWKPILTMKHSLLRLTHMENPTHLQDSFFKQRQLWNQIQ